MIVADSSVIVEELLSGGGEWGKEQYIAPDLAVAEVVSVLTAQRRALNALGDGLPYVRLLFEAIDASSLRLERVSESLAAEAYGIALRNDESIYGCLFIALALKYGARLATRDPRQEAALAKELSLGRRGGGGRR